MSVLIYFKVISRCSVTLEVADEDDTSEFKFVHFDIHFKRGKYLNAHDAVKRIQELNTNPKYQQQVEDFVKEEYTCEKSKLISVDIVNYLDQKERKDEIDDDLIRYERTDL